MKADKVMRYRVTMRSGVTEIFDGATMDISESGVIIIRKADGFVLIAINASEWATIGPEESQNAPAA